jgi:hypothetical protein
MSVRILLVMLVLSASALLGGCQSAGVVSFESRGLEGDPPREVLRRIQLQTPQHPDKAGHLTVHPDGTVSVSTGSQPKISAASRSLGRLTWLGGLLLVGGILALAIRIKFPFLPFELGIGLAVSGVVLMVLPSLIETYLPYILIGLIASAAIVTIYRVNKAGLRLRQLDPADPTPDPLAPGDPSE